MKLSLSIKNRRVNTLWFSLLLKVILLMRSNFKNIHIGEFIHLRVQENKTDLSRICKFMKSTKAEINEMYLQECLSTDILLRWSKLLEYDFFRLYTQHLILYSPAANLYKNNKTSNLPQFRKNIYTQEIIDFILELINTGKKTKRQVTDEYGIPYTTLCRWKSKYDKNL